MNPFSKPHVGNQAPQLDLALQGLENKILTEKPKRKLSLGKIFVAGVVILITLLAFGLIAYLMMGQNKTQENQIAKTEVSDPTANWKTYSASYDSFSFKYPSDLEILEDKYNGKAFRTFVQNDDVQLVIHPGGLSGASNLDAYRINVETVGANNFSSYKISGEEALKYNVIAKGEETIEIITIHNEKAYLITYSYTNPEQIQYLDQILSTFKFTDTETTVDTSGWKTYTDEVFSFNYPDVYSILSQSENEVILGIDYGDKDSDKYIYIRYGNFNPASSLKMCESDWAMLSDECKYDELNINVDRKTALQYSVNHGHDSQYNYLEFDKPKLQISVFTSGGGMTSVYKNLIKTIKFTQ